MKKILLIFFAGCATIVNAQTITTVAGTGTAGHSGDGGQAIAAKINNPTSVAFDASGNFYFAEASSNVVRRVSPSGVISTIAGTEIAGYSGDGGPAPFAMLNRPTTVTVDATGNIYISDNGNNRVRKIDAATGNISTVAGTGTAGYNTDGIAATLASINNPVGVACDASGNVYIADNGNYRIRKVNTSGIISTYAGYGSRGSAGEGGPATSAELYNVNGLACDKSGNLYLTDNDRIRKVDAATHFLKTIAGNGIYGFYGDGLPATSAELWSPYAVSVDAAGNVYIADQYNWRVRQVDAGGIMHTLAGNGSPGYAGDGGSAITAKLYAPKGIALDSCGNLFIADNLNNRIRKVTYTDCPPLSVNNIKSEEAINTYPNPTNGLLNINNVKTPSTYRIINIVGSVLQQGSLKEGSNPISLQTIANGMYLLEVANDKGEKTITKIIKQ